MTHWGIFAQSANRKNIIFKIWNIKGSFQFCSPWKYEVTLSFNRDCMSIQYNNRGLFRGSFLFSRNVRSQIMYSVQPKSIMKTSSLLPALLASSLVSTLLPEKNFTNAWYYSSLNLDMRLVPMSTQASFVFLLSSFFPGHQFG